MGGRSGARGRAFESRRAHSGTSSPASPCVTAGDSVASPALSGVTLRVTNPTFPRRSFSASRCCSTRRSALSPGVPAPGPVPIEDDLHVAQQAGEDLLILLRDVDLTLADIGNANIEGPGASADRLGSLRPGSGSTRRSPRCAGTLALSAWCGRVHPDRGAGSAAGGGSSRPLRRPARVRPRRDGYRLARAGPPPWIGAGARCAGLVRNRTLLAGLVYFSGGARRGRTFLTANFYFFG